MSKKLTDNNRLSILCPDIIEEWNYSRNNGLMPYDFCVNSRRVVWWKCKICGHEYLAKIEDKSRGKKQCIYHRSLGYLNQKLRKEWDYEKNGKLTPYDVLPNSGKKVWWKCKDGHKWYAEIRSRNRNGKKHPNANGCPYCYNRMATENNCLQKTKPDLAKYWHPTKNGKSTPLNVVGGSHKKYFFKCFICGYEWKQDLKYSKDKKSFHGCFNCNCLFNKYPEMSKEWHSTKNGKLTPYDISCLSSKKAWWQCKTCGFEWQSRINGRSKCPNCYFIVIKNGEKFRSALEAYFYLDYKRKGIIFKHSGLYGETLKNKRYDFYIPLTNTYIEVTSYNKQWKYWRNYYKNIIEKRKYVNKVLGANFEFIQKRLNRKETELVRKNQKLKTII